ncbi:MAG TPA: radical SAM protein [candidate division Zixibacteria bacterium]|nr:radical SAM protein [candidate division Zixibacteria bacterium]
MSEFKFYPATVVWEITFACNMRCLHCGTAAGKMRPDELTTEEAFNLIDEMAELGTVGIILSGGEPLLRRDWRKMTERITHNNIKVGIITNGYAVTKEVVDDFERLGMSTVGVSFDGTEKTHNYIRQRDDSWSRALNAMRLMTENGNVRYEAVTQVSNINFGELDQIRDQLIDVGCPMWRIQMTTSTGRMNENRDLVLSFDNFPRLVDQCLEYKEDTRINFDVGENIGYYGCKGQELWNDRRYLGCFAGTRVLGIESNGDIKGCLSMPEEFVEGNIRDSSLTEIWNNPDGFAYNRKFTRDLAEGECHDCKYLPLCRGGCTVTSYSATGCRANNPYCIYRLEKAQGIECEDSPVITEMLEPFKEAMADVYEKA